MPADELEEHLSLLNLVNFGGGCYTIYAELQGATVHVDKELWGDTFRAAPRLTPLEARAIRLALEYVGPMIAADAHSPLARVRKKLEETFGQFDLEQHARDARRRRGGRPRRDARARRPGEPARRDRVPEGSGVGAVDARRRAVLLRARAAQLVRPHVGPDERRRALLPPRPHAQRDADEGAFRAARRLRADEAPQREDGAILYAKDVARYAAERGARRLTDGTALAERPYGDDEWLESEILANRGDAVLVEPAELRTRIAARAKALAKELGVERLRAPA